MTCLSIITIKWNCKALDVSKTKMGKINIKTLNVYNEVRLYKTAVIFGVSSVSLKLKLKDVS